MTQHEIRINLPGLLKMLGSNIYAEPDVAVREMIQNAHDTCIIRKTKDHGFRNPEIHITYNKPQQTLTFSDNGAGMTEDELHENLATIGKSFTDIQRKELRGAGAQEALLLIGQFGIGLLSAFSVAEQVEVFTRSYLPKLSGFKWVCAGDIHYTVEPVDKPNSGTRVVLHVTDKNLMLLDDKRLQQAIKKYADFLSVPIFLKGNQINSCTPPWLKESSTEEYEAYLHTRYDLHPLVSFPFHIERPLYLDGLLFVPSPPSGLIRDFGELDIYIARMFIKANDKELLPHWARFIKGVINTPDLIPTVSRDELVRDEQYALIRNMLGEIILEYLATLEKQNPETLDLIVGTYNNAIKAHSLEDDAFFERICDLVRVSTDAGNLSMQAYLQKSNGVIYYFSERGTATQHKLLFAQKGLPVIDASWGMEEEFLEKYAARKKVTLERLEAGSEMIFKPVTTDDEKWQDLEHQFQICLNKEARAVAFDPNTVPAVLVAKPMERDEKNIDIGAELGLNSAQTRKLLERTKRVSESSDDTILHLNTTNPLMQQLRDMNRNDTFRLALSAILSNATLFAQHYVTPENAEIIFAINNETISSMITNAVAIDQIQGEKTRLEIAFNELQRHPSQATLSEYRTCFFAYPFQEDFHALRKELQHLLRAEYGVKLMATALEQQNANVVADIKRQIAAAHFGMADITGNNPNVLWELGVMIGAGKPVIILKNQHDQMPTPFDLYGEYRLPYQIVKDPLSGEVEYPLLLKGLERNLKRIFADCPELEHAARWTGKEKSAKSGAPKLPKELLGKIVALLTSLPNIHSQSAQRALIYSASLDAELDGRIEVAGSPADFVQVLVDTLSRYGYLSDGRHAIVAVLKTVKQSVGQEKQTECDTLIQELQQLSGRSES